MIYISSMDIGENNGNHVPSTEVLTNLSEIFGVTMDYKGVSETFILKYINKELSITA